MIPLFVPFGQRAPPGSLAVDGAVAGASAIYSHWQGDHTTPAALAADTSTGMLVRAAGDPDRWLAPFAVACNNHVDADGLLSLIAACRPDLARRHGPLLAAAAATGDFTQWNGEAAFDLVLRLHQLIREHQARGAGWEQRCVDEAVAQADALVAGLWPGTDERSAAIVQALAAIAAPPALREHGRLTIVEWRRRLGHATDQFLTVHAPDDLPLVTLSTRIPPDRFQLLVEHIDDGAFVVLDAPRHSWARTGDLPTVAWPDLGATAAALRARDPGVPWTARPGAEEVSFTCLLASRAATRLPIDDLLAVLPPFT